MNDLLDQPAHGFDSERQRNDVEQQHVVTGFIARQHVSLQRGTDRNDPVGIDADKGLALEELAHPVAHVGNARRPADHHNLHDVAVGNVRITQGAPAGHQRLADQGLDQDVHSVARQASAPGQAAGFDRNFGNRLFCKALLGASCSAHQHSGELRLGIITVISLLEYPLCNHVVEIVTAERAVAAGREHFKHAMMQPQYRYIEGAAAQVIDRNHALLPRIQAIGYGRGGRFVQKAQHVQAGKAGRVFRGLPLCFVEIGRHGNNRALQVAAQAFNRAVFQRLENFSRHLGCADIAAGGVYARNGLVRVNKVIRQLAAKHAQVADAAAHETFDRNDGVGRISHRVLCCSRTDLDTVREVTHDRRQQVIAVTIRQGMRIAAAHRCHQ